MRSDPRRRACVKPPSPFPHHPADIANRATDKITPLTDSIYICRSGSAADTQNLSRYVQVGAGLGLQCNREQRSTGRCCHQQHTSRVWRWVAASRGAAT